MTALRLAWLDGRYAVCRLAPAAAMPSWAGGPGGLVSITRTEHELSVVAPEHLVPPDTAAERGWVALRVEGPLEFSLVGILARLTGALAAAAVPVFTISTHDTDYLLVKADDAPAATAALQTVAEIAGEGPA